MAFELNQWFHNSSNWVAVLDRCSHANYLRRYEEEIKRYQLRIKISALIISS
jgi:hypothetical protein|tara:strand:+ start:3297 stop:3452 length:156 start_codon:yes stop_codon:yes gene_type:complete